MQGQGVFDELGTIVAEHGERPVIVIDADIVGLLGSRLNETMDASGLTYHIVPSRGPVTRTHIAAVTAKIPSGYGDVVVGVGGGKALDVAKGVAHQIGRAMISVPTTASNDGPTASIYALYDDTGKLSELGRMPNNPVSVVVDTEIIARAPIRFLMSGIGDAMAKKFEARSCARGHGVTTQGTRPLLIGELIANGCTQILLRDGVRALRDVESGAISAEVEAVIEAVILLSGIGYENGGLSIAHCMTRGLQVGRGSSAHLHGFHVAYGLLVQLALEDDPEVDRGEIHDFLTAVGLPTRLADMGMPSPTKKEIAALGAAAAAAPHTANTWVDASAARIIAAINEVELAARSDGPA